MKGRSLYASILLCLILMVLVQGCTISFKNNFQNNSQAKKILFQIEDTVFLLDTVEINKCRDICHPFYLVRVDWSDLFKTTEHDLGTSLYYVNDYLYAKNKHWNAQGSVLACPSSIYPNLLYAKWENQDSSKAKLACKKFSQE
jgi:hypothetical protein